MNLISIKLNGEEKQIKEETTVQDIINEMDIKNKMFVVEKNLEVLPKEQYSTCKMTDGDNIEIVGFFGGG